ncbi:HAD family hydrolase [Streptomyces fuscigenes]|uniref:HAD family hydrolase n=1 Tax=Streptomyces fuscigenes TaxID=1528880 RepID=UPI001F170169|nr:HAD family phosphatase [Streptomyces fuscigenes]MCF3961293.1 HAD family phosphatase [Streptomyces fuscigenes]
MATPRRLHLFDVDGTLIRGSAAALEISRQLGVTAEVGELERRFVAEGLSPADFAVRARELWAELTVEQVSAAFEQAPWLEGIREVWADIRARGDYCAVISLGPSFFVERLLEWGVHAAHASAWPAVPFTEPVVRSGILSPAAKVSTARRLCAELGIELEYCVAYGDSLSDTELFRVVGSAVAINGDHHVARMATHAYDGGDLRDAYRLVSG